MSYQDYLKSNHWKAVKNIMGSKCKICGSKKSLNIHHKTYKHKNGELVFYNETPSDLICLCQDCHHLWHKYFKKTYLSRKYWAKIKNLYKKGVSLESCFKYVSK